MEKHFKHHLLWLSKVALFQFTEPESRHTLETQAYLWDLVIIANSDIFSWLARQRLTIPCYVIPRPCHGWSCKPTVSVRNVHTLTAVGESDSFLSLSSSSLSLHAMLHSSFLTLPFPLPTLVWELRQGGTSFSCHLSVSVVYLQGGIRGAFWWTKGPERERGKNLSPLGHYLFSLHLPDACLLSDMYCLLCSSSAPVQCLIDAAPLPISSLSVYCSSAPLSDGVPAIKPKGLSAIRGYLN